MIKISHQIVGNNKKLCLEIKIEETPKFKTAKESIIRYEYLTFINLYKNKELMLKFIYRNEGIYEKNIIKYIIDNKIGTILKLVNYYKMNVVYFNNICSSILLEVI